MVSLSLAAPSAAWFRFAVSGAIGYAVGAVLLFLQIEGLGVAPHPAYVVQLAVTVLLVWLLNRYYVWPGATDRAGRAFVAFVASRLGTIALSWLLFTGMVGIGVHYQVANATAIAASTVVNYLLCKHVVFSPSSLPGRHRVPRSVKWRYLLVPVAAVVALLLWAPGPTVLTLWAVNALIMVLVAVFSLARLLYGWDRPDRVSEADLRNMAEPGHRFSLIVPARHEPILPRTLQILLASEYPRDLFEVLVVIADDDPETESLARVVESEHPNVRVVIDSSPRKSKPRSLETARKYCTGDLIGIVDAESVLAPKLLGYVNTVAKHNPDAGVFQGGVQLMNFRSPREKPSWWRARNCLEYFVWFMSRLHYQAQAGFVPLGGNTVFVRRDVIDRVGGWDATCLTEDCDLGVRVCAAGVRTVVFHHPELTTREETPETLSGLVVQRTRWMSGFLQVLAKDDWRALPRKQRFLAFEALTMPLFQAYAGLALLLSLPAMIFYQAPTALVLWMWCPLLIAAVNVVAECAAFRTFGRTFDLPVRWRDIGRVALSSPVYHLVLSTAAVRAVVRLAVGQTGWEKTAHSGAHLGATPEIEIGRIEHPALVGAVAR